MDYRDLWQHSLEEGLVAGGETPEGGLSYSTIWAESPDPDVDSVDMGLAGVGANPYSPTQALDEAPWLAAG